MKFKNISTDNKPIIIAGPCSAENREQVLNTAKEIKKIQAVTAFRSGIWKPRTRPNRFEGVGAIGLKWLNEVKRIYEIPVMTEVANAKHVELCLENNIDMIWIGARTTVNPFYVQEIANTLQGVNIPVFIKNPIHGDIKLWAGGIERMYNSGIRKIIAIHRGCYKNQSSPFRNDPKWEMVSELIRIFPDIDIICDPSHIAGNAKFIKSISQKAYDLSLNGLMIETHINPKKAKTDASQQITPKKLNKILGSLIINNFHK